MQCAPTCGASNGHTRTSEPGKAAEGREHAHSEVPIFARSNKEDNAHSGPGGECLIPIGSRHARLTSLGCSDPCMGRGAGHPQARWQVEPLSPASVSGSWARNQHIVFSRPPEPHRQMAQSNRQCIHFSTSVKHQPFSRTDIIRDIQAESH